MAKEEKEPEFLSESEEIARMAACGFTVSEMALQLGYDRKAFALQAEIVDSDIWTAIQAGKLETDFNVANKQRELAESGNITAVQIFQNVLEAKKVEQLKNRIWFGI